MRKSSDGSSHKPSATLDGVVSRSARSSFRVLSNCLRVISSGASTVARSAVSSASSAVNRDIDSLHDQVIWAGFDKLEKEDGDTRRVLLLAFHSGFQIWDVEETSNVHVIVSAHDGQASFMQMLLNPVKRSEDRFAESRPLLAVCGDSSWDESLNRQSSSDNPGSEIVPTNVHVYSLKSQSYVHTLKFRSIIYTVRCSSRTVAVLQAAQIHCFDATTLEKEYSIVTNSIAYGSLGVGYGPLAVGPRWIAYSGSRIANSNSTVFSPEPLSLSSSPTVTQFARDSSRQIASGIVNLGDKGYKSITRYCSEVLPNPYIPGFKGIEAAKDNVQDADSIGMVIIKDIISKSVVAQFKAHKSPISALSFDPSGMLLVTASIQGHNINVFRIMPTSSSDASKASFVHLFRLQRGFTNAVIQDISFSSDSDLIMISSSRGTSHLFEINPEGDGSSPIPLSAVNRIRSGSSSGWIGTVSGAAAAAAAGMVGSSLPGAVASTFCNSDGANNNNNRYGSDNSSKRNRNLLVFAASGSMTQYALKENSVGAGHETSAAMKGFDFESGLESEGKVAVEPIRRWSMIQNQTRREMMQDHHRDIYGGGTSSDSKSKVFPEIVRKQSVEESWKVTKRRVDDKHQFYISEAELQMYQPSELPLWAMRKFRFQELVWNVDDESDGGGGEVEIEGIQTRTIEARTRDLVPVWGYLHSPKSHRLTTETFPRPKSTREDEQVEGHGRETDLGVVHSREETPPGSETESSLSEEDSQSNHVYNGNGIAEEKAHTTEDEDDDDGDKELD